MSMMLKSCAALAALGVALAGAPAKADSVADFYRGNTVNILLGTGPGATYDFYARIFANHYARHIPGNPTVVVQYMPGAGGMNMFNHLYNAAPRDGTAIGNVFGTLPVMQLLRPEAARYDAAKFNWLGSVSRDVYVVAVNRDAPATTIEEAKKTEVVIGSIGRGNMTFFFPSLINSVIGTKLRIISGYPSGAEIYKAMEGREVHGYAPVWLSLVTVKPDWLRDQKIAVLAQSGLARLPELPDAPLLLELAETEEQRQMAQFLASTSPLDRATAAPPDVPADRIRALVDAYAATVKDPAFLAEMKQRNLTVDPSSQAEVVDAVRQIVDTPPAIQARIKQAFDM